MAHSLFATIPRAIEVLFSGQGPCRRCGTQANLDFMLRIYSFIGDPAHRIW